MNNHIKLTIQSLISTYPLYSKEDILVLDTLSPYADPEVFILINSPDSLSQLNSIHSALSTNIPQPVSIY